MSPPLERALLLIQQRRYDMAEREAGAALADNPDDAMAHAMMALSLLGQKRLGEANEHALQATGLSPDHDLTFYVLALVLIEKEDLDGATKAINQAISLDPYDPRYHHVLGTIHAERKQWNDAAHCAALALELDPENVDALNLQGMALRNLGRSVEAGDQFRAALSQDPDDPHTHASLGWNHLQRGERAKAMEHFREALRLDPNLEAARLGAIETLKSYNPLYRVILNFFIWMQSKTAGNQWGVVLGAWLVYFICYRTAVAQPQLRIFLYPIIGAYLLFAVGTWFAVPLANFTLWAHPFGRLALTRKEKWEFVVVTALLLIMLGGLAGWVTLDSDTRAGSLCSTAFFYPGLLVVPVAMTFRARRGSPLKWMLLYTTGMAILGLPFAVSDTVIGYMGNIPVDEAPAWLLQTRTIGGNTFVPYQLGCILSVFAANYFGIHGRRG